MENHVPVSPCSATVTLGTYAALWPENLDGCADAVEMLHSACWRTDVKEVVQCLHCLYRKPEKVFKPSETPLFPTIFVGLTGFEPATFCSQSRRATKLRYSPFLLAFSEPALRNRIM